MRFHLFPFRTEKLSSLTPMVLRFSRGRVGSRLFKVRSLDLTFFMPLSELPRYSCRKNKSYVTDWPLWQQKRSGRSSEIFPKGQSGRSGYGARCTCGCRFLPFAIGGVLIAGALSTARLSFYPLFNLQLSQCAPVLPDHPVLSKQ